VPAQQQVRRSDMQHWAAANAFAELQELFALTAAAPTGTTTAGPIGPAGRTQSIDEATSATMRSRASWFYWIAGLSLVNSIVAVSGQSFRFIFGLGITQVFDEIANHMASSGKVVALGLDVVAAGILVLMGVFAHKGHLWAFIVGMVLLALDEALLLVATDWLG